MPSIEPAHKRCRTAGGMALPTIDTSTTFSASSPFFQPRPFPPPGLAGVPLEYISSQLRGLAGNYWNQPDTADCTLVVPVPYPKGRESLLASASSDSLISPRPTLGTSTAGRRESEPALNAVPRISMKLHIDYLSTHSSYLRGLFSGATPLGLINSSVDPSSSAPIVSGKFTIPANRLPKLMPSDTNHPILFLPVPDPSSLHLLVHWMYFGSTAHIEDALNRGLVQWEGLARNTEYLGLSTDLKVFLGKWYRDWLHRPDDEPLADEQGEEYDSDTAYSEMDEDEYEYDYDSDDSSLSDMDMDDGTFPSKGDDSSISLEVEALEIDSEPRGRNRAIRCLSWAGPGNQDTPDSDRSLSIPKSDSGRFLTPPPPS